MDSLENLKIHHIGIAVYSIKAAEKFYSGMGMRRVSDLIHDPEQRVRAVLLGYPTQGDGPLIELVEPAQSPSPIDRFLGSTSSIFHYCVEVPDLTKALGTAKSQDAIIVRRPVEAPLFENRNIAWILAPSGNLVELLEAHA